MTYEVFENAMKEALIKTYIEEYGEEAWTSQTAKKNGWEFVGTVAQLLNA